MVIKKKNSFVVCITIEGKKLNFAKLKEISDDNKIRLATSDELQEYFGAEPGCAYPFGFAEDISIYIDPIVYEQEWFLFSPLYPTKTIQIKGNNLKTIFRQIKNKILETEEVFL